MSDRGDPDDEKVTEADAVVQTANGERYRATTISKSGHSPDPDEGGSLLSDLAKRIWQR